ncbi:oligopeptide transporter, OPT family [Actinomyces bovis]|uniref:Oligopeptide transporter, OPT family n=1 Tax=Actinomyces bovis TaxID=1658 RepID=A0ABY1VMW2_9ACTO|nr:oligopeptide transporter, OPT family [Actinomyces bovis]SPT52393.1 oligopeptide transporter, OPT family [Actinomyces bovis]VEG53993.1 oligopeptide transporter, OPT family [Actinomyces israelii]
MSPSKSKAAAGPAAKTAAAPLNVKELTLRGVIIGGLITIVFTAANVYLGLKAGLTFATSIPAAVISMAVLRYFKDHTIQENNIVQTIASAAGTLSAIIFVLPGLVMVGWWQGFPYWQSVFVIALGGLLGVMYSIPLRRALVTNSDLPYPEGVAAAEVLRVGDTNEGAEESRRGLLAIIWGGLASAGFAILGSLKAVATEVSGAFKIGSGGTMAAGSLSLALIGVGHLVGIGVGIAMIVGLLISYGILLPMQTWGQLDGSVELAKAVGGVFKSDVRLIGAGTIAVAAVWTLIKLIGPIVVGIKDSLSSTARRESGQEVDITERDLSAKVVMGVILASMLPIGVLLWLFVRGTAIEHSAWGLVFISIVFVLLTGLAVASVCGYMAGLIGASNSPISGVGIIVAIAAALVVKVVHGTVQGDQLSALVAYTLFTAAVVFGIATISNDNLQDLKTGQLVGATPWKQQVALIIGVGFGAVIIPPVLNLMQKAFGFQGAPGAGENALSAPQASLISDLIKGVFGGNLNWKLIGLGAAIGVVVIIINEVLTRTTKNLSLPGLAVGMGMYLPMAITIMIPIGAVLGLLHDKWAEKQANPERAKRMGTLVATGLIVGESLWGVVYAGIVGASGEDEPLAIMPDSFAKLAICLGALLFCGIIAVLYRLARREGARD